MGNSPVTGEFPAQRPVTRGFDVFFELRLNIRLSKQSWGWWSETTSRPLWHHCNEIGSRKHYHLAIAGDNNWNPAVDVLCKVLISTYIRYTFLQALSKVLHFYPWPWGQWWYFELIWNANIANFHIRSILMIIKTYNTEAETRWSTFRKRHFQKHCLEWKYMNVSLVCF